ncbi:MAG: nitroreductase family deazaflavin-dependent oxidoreductase [Acidimicrobiia bacterium]
MSRIDEAPSKLMRLIYRAPIYVYRAGLGRLMSKRLLLLTHTGRNSGEPRYAVLEVARYDEQNGAFFVPAAYGLKSDWYRNLRRTPEAKINHRGMHQDVLAETISTDAATDEFAAYATSHPRAAANLGKMMGIPFEDPRAVAETIPLVALRRR